MEKHQDLTPVQIGAIRKGIILGRTLKTDYPEIAEMYESGFTLLRIVKELNINPNRDNDNISINGVHHAISGHDGGFEIEAYEGLISDEEERERIAREHIVESGRKAYEEGTGVHALSREVNRGYGRKSYEEGKGIHGRTAKQIREDSRKGGLKSYEEGKGIHGRTAEQHSEDSLKGNIARGITLWTDKEFEYAYQLSLKPGYQHSKGVNKGKSNHKLIAIALNIEYHGCNEVRNAKAVKNQLNRHKKSLEDKVD